VGALLERQGAGHEQADRQQRDDAEPMPKQSVLEVGEHPVRAGIGEPQRGDPDRLAGLSASAEGEA
jgi:hypothetical protein